jgi:hypothetical protein
MDAQYAKYALQKVHQQHKHQSSQLLKNHLQLGNQHQKAQLYPPQLKNHQLKVPPLQHVHHVHVEEEVQPCVTVNALPVQNAHHLQQINHAFNASAQSSQEWTPHLIVYVHQTLAT